jgi:tetratricopeptide (TPR) repeat protein
MPPPPLWVPIIPAVLVVAFVVFGIRKSWRSKEAGPRMSRAWAAFALAVIAFAVIAAVIASRPGPIGAAVNRAMLYLAFAPLVLLALLLVLILVQWLKFRDPYANRAFVRAGEGDIDGAIRELVEVVEIRGQTGHRANALGVLTLQKGEYAKSLEWFGEAERLGYNAKVCRANRAVALRKMGRAEEAVELFQDLVSDASDDPTLAGLYCLALADVGRFNEARDQLLRAEALPQVVGQNRAHRTGFEKLIAECREKLGGPTDGEESSRTGPVVHGT